MKTIEQYILQTDAKSAGIVGFLRQLILSCSPAITEDVHNNMPYYYYYGKLCYVEACPEGVALSFCHGKDISDPFTIMKTAHNPQETKLCFRDIKDIDYDKVLPLLQQAMLINELMERAHINTSHKPAVNHIID